MINILLEKGGNINQTTEELKTPFEIALANHNFLTMKALLLNKKLNFLIIPGKGVYHVISDLINYKDGLQIMNDIIELVSN